MDGDGGDSLERMASEVCQGYRGWRNEWQASLVDSWGSSGKTLGLWTQKYEEQMKKEHRRLYCIKGADYGCGSSPKAGLCGLNRQERRRQL
jgi:hypothetical protein